MQRVLKDAEISLFANDEICMFLEDAHKGCLTVPSFKKFLRSLMVEPVAGECQSLTLPDLNVNTALLLKKGKITLQ